MLLHWRGGGEVVSFDSIVKAATLMPSSATSSNQEMSKESEKVPDVNNPEDSLTRAPKRARQDSETTDL